MLSSVWQFAQGYCEEHHSGILPERPVNINIRALILPTARGRERVGEGGRVVANV